MITISNLSKSFGDKAALQGVSLTVERGETVVLLGHSGSGKSTLLRCLVGLTRFDGGEISVDGISLAAGIAGESRRRALADIRRRCGLVFQQYHLFPHLTVLQNLALAPLNVQGVTRDVANERAAKLLEALGLADKGSARPHTLSGGEQQRVAVARALALEPDYLLYDEPTSALDPQRAREMWALMAKLAREGQTQVVVTHQEQITEALPCRVIRMEAGRVI